MSHPNRDRPSLSTNDTAVEQDYRPLFDTEGFDSRHPPAGRAPLVLRANSKTTIDDVVGIAPMLRTDLDRHHVLLLRGLPVNEPATFARIADATFADLPRYRTVEHPAIDTASAVYQPVAFTASETLLWHHEDSFAAQWPRYVMFACTTPAETGGQTTLVDTRSVYRAMPDDIRELLHRYGIRYERRCDGRAGRGWEQLYGTTDPDQAVDFARERGENLRFESNATAWITHHRPAFLDIDTAPAWFNQILHWHTAALPPDIASMTRENLIPTYRNCAIGDGTPIADNTVATLIAVHRDTEYEVAWRTGDVLLIDNTAVAHGRRPYTGARAHLVRLAGVGTYPERVGQ